MPRLDRRALARRAFGPFLVVAGALHFVRPAAYEAIMPDALPAHRALVLASGAAEIAAGAATLHPRTRAAGSALALATLTAVFPANIHMARQPERHPGVPGGRVTLLARLPLQLVLLAWARAARR
jgi:uncharacterized membrane protein